MSTFALRPLKLRSLKFLLPSTRQPKQSGQMEGQTKRSHPPICSTHRWQLEQAERDRKLQQFYALERRFF